MISSMIYKVFDIEYDDYGTETRKCLFSHPNINKCWQFVINRQLHPSKKIRDEASRLFVIDPYGKMCTRIPKRVKDTVV
jgi:hypothetical protein